MGELGFVAIILSLLAHAATKQQWCAVLLRVFFGLVTFTVLMSSISFVSDAPSENATPIMGVSAITGALFLIAIQFKPVRACLSPLFTCVNQIVTGRPLLACLGRLKDAEGAPVSFGRSFLHEKIFLAESLPHLNGLFCYITLLTLCIGSIKPSGFISPILMHAPHMMPILEDILSTLMGILLSFFGVGFLVARRFPQVLKRLGVEIPRLTNVAIALTAVVATFVYDYVGSLFTHSASGKAAGVMAQFNEGTYLANGKAPTAFVQALTTGVTAGLEEELMFRGAVQPALGIVPAALLHGAMHQQFAGAPLWILQIFIWSAAMGVLRRYTNTTTTIIAHGTFNFIQVFLIGFNP